MSFKYHNDPDPQPQPVALEGTKGSEDAVPGTEMRDPVSPKYRDPDNPPETEKETDLPEGKAVAQASVDAPWTGDDRKGQDPGPITTGQRDQIMTPEGPVDG